MSTTQHKYDTYVMLFYLLFLCEDYPQALIFISELFFFDDVLASSVLFK